MTKDQEPRTKDQGPRTVFVSGCFDILHGGHVEFFRQARELGDRLVVCIPSDEVLFLHKKRRPFIPLEHKIRLIRAIELVDHVVVGDDRELGLNFRTLFRKMKPAVLAVTEDDRFEQIKRALCREVGAKYVRLPKSLDYDPTSTTEIYRRLHAPVEAPLRVDFAGGWLDVPRFSRPDGYIVNCAISPLVSLYGWPYEACAGLGGSGAYALLTAQDGVATELARNVGWQDPVVIRETGLCVWKSGPEPVLELKLNPAFLEGTLALYWTGKPHVTADLAELPRDYDLLAEGSRIGAEAVRARDLDGLCEAIRLTHEVQLKEGMDALPDFGEKARKYCGGGHGGYAVYLFDDRPSRDELISIEPYMRDFAE